MTPKRFKLMGDKVAVEYIEPVNAKVGRIHIPSTAIEQSGVKQAIIRFVGNKLSEPSLKVGSKVLVTIYDSLPKIKWNDRELRLYDTEKVLAVLT